ncbi:hypothetical protein LNTAR_15207 [Lentisphaera araneosa HTCC2155]|uniref:Uncharacterized protein n=1 Tax=Lentisphaera araneosa HTCC2155 TaxID=313628 RepID=A6DRG6_9BACT|nr:hypothetical protein [Lentisphaera araneosa]EDM25776.1 hypothetical protein LNTAR_15207 [Lentisphaera araneosa HTCC2155]
MTISYEIEYADKDLKKRQLENLIEKRNYLVDHLIQDWDGDCEGSFKEVLDKLTQSHEEARVELKDIQEKLKGLSELMTVNMTALKDPVTQVRMMNPNFNALYELAISRSKEWISLNEAGKYILKTTGVCFTKSQFRDGFKKLSDYMNNSEFLELNTVDELICFRIKK